VIEELGYGESDGVWIEPLDWWERHPSAPENPKLEDR
jgi:hypothetical protein